MLRSYDWYWWSLISFNHLRSSTTLLFRNFSQSKLLYLQTFINLLIKNFNISKKYNFKYIRMMIIGKFVTYQREPCKILEIRLRFKLFKLNSEKTTFLQLKWLLTLLLKELIYGLGLLKIAGLGKTNELEIYKFSKNYMNINLFTS